MLNCCALGVFNQRHCSDVKSFLRNFGVLVMPVTSCASHTQAMFGKLT